MASTASLVVWCFVASLAAAEYAVLHVEQESGESRDFCVNYNPQFSDLPSQYEAMTRHHLVDATDSQECLDIGKLPYNFRDRLVAIETHSCHHSLASLLQLQELKVYGVLVVSPANSSKVVKPTLQNPALYSELPLKVAAISASNFEMVEKLAANGSLWLFKPWVSKFDPSMVFIILLAVLCVVVGALWAEKLPPEEQKTSDEVWNACCGVYFYLLSCGKRCEKLGGFLVILTYLACLSSLLILLYFFYSFMVYLFIGIFVIFGSVSLCACILPVWKKMFPCECRLPLVKWEPEVRAVLLFLLCAALAVFWAVKRHASYAWTLQDLIGVAFCIYCIKDFRIKNLKICSIILAIVFVYDVFFVFITPFFTKDGRSVMESVALGGEETDSAPVQTPPPREQLPILFRMPPTIRSSMHVCVETSMLGLGFGDVVFPGILIVHNIRFDNKVQTSCKLYFVLTTIGYAVSLGIAYLAVVFMERGQPALFYIVPITLLVTVVLGLARGELSHLWTGEAPGGCLLPGDALAQEENEMGVVAKQQGVEEEEAAT